MSQCKTCEQAIQEDANFCPNCGAQQINERLTLWTLLKTLFARLANLDFTFYRSSKALLIKPEAVTIGYIRGVRKIFNPPIQYALIVLSLYGLFQFFFSDFLNLSSQNNFLNGFGEGFSNYEGSSENIERGKRMNEAINWLQSRNQFFIFSLIPCMGILSSLFYKKFAYNLAEHTVISIYATSFTLALSVLIGLLLAPFNSTIAAVIYLNSTIILTIAAIAWIFYRSLKGSLLKPFLVLFLSMAIMFFVVVLLLLAIIA